MQLPHFLPDTACPWCRAVSNVARPMEAYTSRPQPGDVAWCHACGRLSLYAHDLTMRRPTPDEAREIDADPAVIAVRSRRGTL